MRPFVLNGDVWRPVVVSPSDERLIDRTGRSRLATTDPDTMCIYISKGLKGFDLQTVVSHEIGHCAMISYGLLDSLHRIVPQSAWIDVEEWVCNFLADYGREVINAANIALSVPVAVRRVA